MIVEMIICLLLGVLIGAALTGLYFSLRSLEKVEEQPFRHPHTSGFMYNWAYDFLDSVRGHRDIIFQLMQCSGHRNTGHLAHRLASTMAEDLIQQVQQRIETGYLGTNDYEDWSDPGMQQEWQDNIRLLEQIQDELTKVLIMADYPLGPVEDDWISFLSWKQKADKEARNGHQESGDDSNESDHSNAL